MLDCKELSVYGATVVLDDFIGFLIVNNQENVNLKQLRKLSDFPDEGVLSLAPHVYV